jgi:nitrogen fixation NifU-like protein
MKAKEVSKRSQGFGDPAVASDEEIGLGQDRLDVDIHFSSTRHPHAEEFVGHVEGDDARLLRLNASQGFAPDSTLGASAAHPAENQLSLRVDDGLRSTPRRGRALHANHSGYGKGFPLGRKLAGFGIEIQGRSIAYDSSPERGSAIGTGDFALYSERVRAHYAEPRNVGTIAEPSGKAIVKSPVDSDTVLITLRIEQGVIQDVKFKCMGCAVAIACSSMATEMVLGKSVEEASQISEQAVADALGGIPDYKMRCSNLAPEAIRRAIEDWQSRDYGTTPS